MSGSFKHRFIDLAQVLIVLSLVVGCSQGFRPPTATEHDPPDGLGNRSQLAGALAGLKVHPRSTVVSTAPSYLEVSVPVTNTTDSIVTLEYGACAVTILLYRNADRLGDPAWNSAYRTTPDGTPYACPLYLVVDDVPPGVTRRPPELRSSIPVFEILGDSLATGRYFVSILFRLNWVETKLDGGAVELSDDYGRLPTERTVNSVRYRAETAVIQPSPAQVAFTIVRTNTGNQPVEIRLERGVDCPAFLHAYRDPSGRDAAYLVPPDWSASFGCDLGRGRITLEPAETDRSVTFEIHSAEIPAGQWFFAVGLRTEAPWPEGSVLLAAGEATLNR